MGRDRPFTWSPEFPVVARIPLLPVAPGDFHDEEDETVDAPLYEAVRFGSRSFGRLDIESVDSGKTRATLRAYELRARTRATPRGSFAGVQIARAARTARFRIGRAHRARSVPCAGWLADLARQVTETPDVLERLRLSANDLVARRGDRFENEPASSSPTRVTLRATRAVELILDTCRTGAALGEIVAAIAATWPGAPEQKVRDTVLELVRQGFLLTDLLPDPAGDDPLGHVLSKLPEQHDLARPLAMIRRHLKQADLYQPGAPERLAALAAARDICDAICRHDSPIAVDVAVDAGIEVPTSLLTEASDAAGLLWAITPSETALASYHSRFVDRYGIGRRIPLLSVVDPVTGLGDPDTGSDSAPVAEPPPGRARALAALIASSMASGGAEVVLDDATIAALRVRGGNAGPSPSGEVYVRVVAASQNDLDAGRYQLAAYFGCTQDAGSSIGRFASLLPGCVRDAGAEWAPAVTAEVVVHPRLPKLDTVAAPTGFTQTRICVGVAPRPGDLTLDDLQLASDGHRFVLWSRGRDEEVVPALYSRIGPAYLPAVARLLRQLVRSGTRPWHIWSWGPLSAAPFQPRVRWRRIVLSPARWRLSHTLVAAAVNATGWDAELDRWRDATVPAPPRIVVAEEADRRLPLDLDDARDRDLLRRYVRRGTDTVTEPPGGPHAVQGVVAGPAGGHALELVIPLKGRHQPGKRPRPEPATTPVIHMPGGEWLSLAITSPAIHHDDVLAHIESITKLVCGDVDRWFWLRYDDAAHGPHLRVRFAGDRGALVARVLPAVSHRCAKLMADGLVRTIAVEPYEPEIDRYGGPTAIEAAERVFHTDSSLVLALLPVLSARPGDDHRLMLGAVSAAEIARTVAGGDPAAIGRPRLDRPAHRQVQALRAQAPAQAADLLDDAASAAWRRREQSLAAYRDTVPLARRADCASSIIHMHANRLGLDRHAEHRARALAAQLLAQETR